MVIPVGFAIDGKVAEQPSITKCFGVLNVFYNLSLRLGLSKLIHP
jgi:hypothetical protein